MKTSSIILVLLFLFCGILSSQEEYKPTDKIVWKFKTGDKIYATPTVNKNTIYFGSLDEKFYAIDAKTGKEKWHFKTKHPIQSTACIFNNSIIFESGNKLYALSLQGKQKWSFNLHIEQVNNQLDPWDFHHSSPTLTEGIVYIGTEQGKVYGIDVKTGKKVFEFQSKNKASIRTTVIIKNNIAYFGDWEGVFYAIDTKSGTKAWEYDTKNDKTYGWKNAIQTNPVIFENNIYFAGRSSCLYALDLKTGKKNWTFRSPTDQWLVGGLQIKDGVIYVGSSDQHLFYAFDAKTGKVKWQTKLDCRIWGTPAFANNNIYIGANCFFILDIETGQVKSKIYFAKINKDKKYGEYVDRRANFHSSPIINDGKIYIGSDDGCVYALKL